MLDYRSDAELITAARSGNEAAYDQLYRRHSEAAQRFSRSLAGLSADAEDVVAEAFARVLAALRAGNGPDEAFRPYLLSAVRNAFYDTTRRAGRERAVDDVSPFTPDVPFADPVAAEEESTLVATAFGELPERWQVVLWHTEVEGEKPASVAPILGISANAVAALAYRAREGLRERYLQAHAATAYDEACRPTVDQLGAYTRHKLTRAETKRVRAHLDDCHRCALLFGELSDVNARLGVFIGPAILGAAAAAYLPAAGATTGAGAAVGVLRRVVNRRESQVGLGVAVVTGLVVLALALLSADPPPDLVDSSEPPLSTPTQARPSATTTPSSMPGSSAAPGAPPASQTPSPSASAAPPAAGLTVALRSIGSLVRGRPGVLSVLVTNRSDDASGAMTATFSLPSGITLRGAAAGGGWTCVGGGAITCQTSNLAAGASSTAHVQVDVAVGAGAGVPAVTLTGPRVVTVTVSAAEGVVGSGLGAVMAATGAVALRSAGNALLSCPQNAPGCEPARNGELDWLGVGNTAYNMTFYRDPAAPSGAPGGAAVSGATLNLAGDVVWAGLYWAGSGNAPGTPTAYVRPPGAAGYQAIMATTVDQLPAVSAQKAMYQASADATALVRTASGSGTWWVAVPSNAFAAGHGSFGGWALLVVVDDGGSDRTVVVFDGGVRMQSASSLSGVANGIAGTVSSVGIVGWEGDRGLSGDSVRINGVGVDAPNQNNIASSRADGTAAGWNTFGTDVRVVTTAIGGTDPAVVAGSTGDIWVLGALALVATP